MDTRDGSIYYEEQIKLMSEIDKQYLKPMQYDPTLLQRIRGKIGRNELCPCGSGKKFKKCCEWRKKLDEI